MNARKSIRTIILMLALILGATSEVCALETLTHTSGVTLLVETNPDATGTVVIKTVEDISGSSQTDKWKVTLRITPPADYYVNKNTITVEKMISLPASSRRRAPILADKLTVSGDDEASNSDPQDYSFNIPTGYNNAYVTVDYYKKNGS